MVYSSENLATFRRPFLVHWQALWNGSIAPTNRAARSPLILPRPVRAGVCGLSPECLSEISSPCGASWLIGPTFTRPTRPPPYVLQQYCDHISPTRPSARGRCFHFTVSSICRIVSSRNCPLQRLGTVNRVVLVKRIARCDISIPAIGVADVNSEFRKSCTIYRSSYPAQVHTSSSACPRNPSDLSPIPARFDGLTQALPDRRFSRRVPPVPAPLPPLPRRSGSGWAPGALLSSLGSPNAGW
jgi:hypothetical protein